MLSPTADSTPADARPLATAAPAASAGRRRRRRHFAKGHGWPITFVVLALFLFVVVGYFTGVEAIAASARFLWNALAAVTNSAIRAVGGLLALLAKGVGWRRLSRIATALAGVGLGYAGGVVLSNDRLRRARGWSGKLKVAFATLRNRWLGLHLAWKLAIVAALIASQVYLHFLLILFPIAFLVPVVRRLWVQVADLAVGRWYWTHFGRTHRAVVAFLRRLPGVRHLIGWSRLTRIRYLRAWRLWKHDPRYRCPETGRHTVDLIEPVRLWWRGDLDGYVGHPLLCGRASTKAEAKP